MHHRKEETYLITGVLSNGRSSNSNRDNSHNQVGVVTTMATEADGDTGGDKNFHTLELL